MFIWIYSYVGTWLYMHMHAHMDTYSNGIYTCIHTYIQHILQYMRIYIYINHTYGKTYFVCSIRSDSIISAELMLPWIKKIIVRTLNYWKTENNRTYLSSDAESGLSTSSPNEELRATSISFILLSPSSSCSCCAYNYRSWECMYESHYRTCLYVTLTIEFDSDTLVPPLSWLMEKYLRNSKADIELSLSTWATIAALSQSHQNWKHLE